MKSFVIKYYSFFPLIVLCYFYIVRATYFPIHDFGNYYFGGYFLKTNAFDYQIYFPYHFNKSIANLGYSNLFLSYAPNTPFLAFCFVPFAMLSLSTAKIIFNCISTILFLYAIKKLVTFYKIENKAVVILPILFLVPIKNNLLFGQVYFILFYLLTEFWISYEKGQNWKSSLFLSLAILLKVFPIIFVLFLLFRKETKTILYTFSICLLLFGLSTFITGIEVWQFFFRFVLPKASNGEIATAFVDNYQSVFMFLKRVFIYDQIENPNPNFPNSKLFLISNIIFKVLVIGIGYIITKKEISNLLQFSFWTTTSILISPYGSTYTFLLLIIPFIAISKSEVPDTKKYFFYFLLLFICYIPINNVLKLPFPLSYLRLLALIIFTLVLVLTTLNSVKFNWKYLWVLIIFLPLPFIIKPIKVNSQAFLGKHIPILIYDYKINDNQLTYFYWNENGKNKTIIPFHHKSKKNLEIIQNQIHHDGKPITFDNSNKLNPILVDDKTILYLSDYERGIGFYKLWKMNIE